jgi:hypothetical protein
VAARRLAILPGKCWTGTITVRSETAEGWDVDFDADATPGGGNEGQINYQTVLTTEQILEWTGIDMRGAP